MAVKYINVRRMISREPKCTNDVALMAHKGILESLMVQHGHCPLLANLNQIIPEKRRPHVKYELP